MWLLLAPRDYLSTFLKLGTVLLLAVAVIVMRPQLQMSAVTQFIDGSGPIFGGTLFPFAFITSDADCHNQEIFSLDRNSGSRALEKNCELHHDAEKIFWQFSRRFLRQVFSTTDFLEYSR